MAKNPTLREVHEYILVFSNGRLSRESLGRKSTLSREAFLELTRSVWTLAAKPARKVGHPAPFPVGLPYRLIQLYTFEGEVVLDSSMGSGPTAIAALKTGRHYLGYDSSPEYGKLAEKRLQALKVEQQAPSPLELEKLA